jgi:glucose/arabinose dehydrogenase
MKRGSLLVIAVATLSSSIVAQTLTDSRLKVETWAMSLSQPTTFTWIGPGELLVIQKGDGKVKWYKDGVFKGTALDLKVQNDSERGGLGIAADPDFVNNSHVYVYYSTTSASGDSANSSKWSDNRVERYDWNGSTLTNKFGPLVAFPTDSAQSNGPNHDGGVIRFGADGMLYGQTGDLNRGRMGGGNERVEQNTATSGSAMVGGFFRLMSDGSIPGDNPFVGESDPNLHLWWTYGLRNAFGFTWDAVTGSLWDTENGPNVYDEINLVPKGMNSGWLKIMGPDSRNATYFENGNTSYDVSDLTMLTNSVYQDPALSFLSPIGITSIGFIHSTLYPPDLRENVIVGDNNTGDLYFLTMKPARDSFKLPAGLGDKVVDSSNERNKIVWGSNWQVPTDIQMGADGYVYVASLGLGKILRIRPLVDSVMPQMLFPPGTVFIGAIENAQASDDKLYIVQEKGHSKKPLPYKFFGKFTLNFNNPTSVTIELEDSFPKWAYQQDIYVHNLATHHFELVDSALIGTTDVMRSISLSPPSNYVDPVTKEVLVRVDVTPGNSAKVGRTGPRDLINVRIDLFDLAVAYP